MKANGGISFFGGFKPTKIDPFPHLRSNMLCTSTIVISKLRHVSCRKDYGTPLVNAGLLSYPFLYNSVYIENASHEYIEALAEYIYYEGEYF